MKFSKAVNIYKFQRQIRLRKKS